MIWDGVALDVTDRREALDALERALSQARRDEVSDRRFSAIASQDIAGPLDHLRRAIERLRPQDRGSTGDAADLIDDAIAAFDHFQTAFAATTALVVGDGPPLETARPRSRLQSGEKTAPALTRRQADVLELVRRGASNRQIAEDLGIGEGTVKLHVSAILKALGVKNRTMAAASEWS